MLMFWFDCPKPSALPSSTSSVQFFPCLFARETRQAIPFLLASEPREFFRCESAEKSVTCCGEPSTFPPARSSNFANSRSRLPSKRGTVASAPSPLHKTWPSPSAEVCSGNSRISVFPSLGGHSKRSESGVIATRSDGSSARTRVLKTTSVASRQRMRKSKKRRDFMNQIKRLSIRKYMT